MEVLHAFKHALINLSTSVFHLKYDRNNFRYIGEKLSRFDNLFQTIIWV